MSLVGLLLLVAAAITLVVTGLPAFVVLIGAALVGGLVAIAGGLPVAVFAALPSRLVGLLENDLIQAIPLYVLMGALIDRLPIAGAIFRTLARVVPGRGRALVAGLGLGALMGPMNGSVGASVVALTRTLSPELKRAGVDPASRQALIAVAGTLGMVVPPSLVLILLGDAMLAAHTSALNATGRFDLVVNTRDIFRAAMIPAGLFLLGAFVVAWFLGRRAETGSGDDGVSKPSRSDVAVTIVSVGSLVALLGGVAAGRFYAVEAAAMGAVVLFVAAVIGGRLGNGGLTAILDETLRVTGVLFALLMAATTFTLVLRMLGTDRLVTQAISSVPGGSLGAAAAGLAIVAVSAFVLDAFEIIFVIVPIVAPAMLVRIEDAAWVAMLILLTLQASFLLPPVGYALMLSRGLMPDAPDLRFTLAKLGPFLAVLMAIIGLVLTFPSFAHPERLWGTVQSAETKKGLDDLPLPSLPPPPGAVGN